MKTFEIIVTFFISQVFITFIPIAFAVNLSFHLIRMDYVFFVFLYDSFNSICNHMRNVYRWMFVLSWCVCVWVRVGGSFLPMSTPESILCVSLSLPVQSIELYAFRRWI